MNLFIYRRLVQIITALTVVLAVNAQAENNRWLFIDTWSGILVEEVAKDGSRTYDLQHYSTWELNKYTIEITSSKDTSKDIIIIVYRVDNTNWKEHGKEEKSFVLCRNDRGNWDLIGGTVRDRTRYRGSNLKSIESLPFNNEDFAHRIPDSIDPELIYDWEKNKDSLQEVLEQSGNSKSDPLLVIFRMDLALLEEEAGELKNLLREYRQEFEQSTSNFFRSVPRYYDIQLEKMAIYEEDLESLRFVLARHQENASIQIQTELDLESFRTRYNALTSDYHYVGSLKPLLLKKRNHYPPFLLIQFNAKVMMVLSEFDMMKGRIDHAAETLIGSALLGAMMNNEGLIQLEIMIGVAVLALTIDSLEILVMNGYTESTHFHDLRDSIHSLYNKYILYSEEQEFAWAMNNREYSVLQILAGERRVRRKNVKARLAILRFLADIQLNRLEGAALSEGLIRQFLLPDPFLDDRDVQYRLDESGEYTLWSVGPDKISQEGAIQYDPTNGTWSRGDLILTVPAKRKYPFPSSPGRIRV